ncbi:hypothetical protein M513_05808 [Trichuris suis]|uniref:Uncharacterized protein n=1 Tax=Trichuris suis TaxID=68888 RepID=A0A085M7Y1_9BILA|nr:hypothetical protein M513_05808 [Trichuris suis]
MAAVVCTPLRGDTTYFGDEGEIRTHALKIRQQPPSPARENIPMKPSSRQFPVKQCFRCGSTAHLANAAECRARNLQCRYSAKAEHDKNLNSVLQRIRCSGLVLNDAKCKWSQNEILFLGEALMTGTGVSRKLRQ